MYIHSLELKNLRSFQSAKIEFSPGINIITGANNSGKSTIIKSLYKLQDLNIMGKDDIRRSQFQADILVGLKDANEKERWLFRSKEGKFYPRNGEIFVRHVIKEQSFSNIFFEIQEDTDKIDIENLSGISYLDLPSGTFPGFPRMEDRNNFIYPFFAKRKTSLFGTQGGKENTYSVVDDLRNLPAKVQKTSNQAVNRDRYKQLCLDILGFEIGMIPGDNHDIKVGIYPEYYPVISIESMGEGVANILGLITILLTEDRKLFLIEELENDIHPQALKKLLALIIEKSTSNQFIISTHSNIILKHLGKLPETKLFYIDWVPYEDNARNNIPTSKIQEVKTPEERQQVLEQLGYELLDYDLYKGYIIFEESSAEKIVKDFLIPQFVGSSLGDTLRTVAAQGVDDIDTKFHTLSTLFMYLHRTEVYKGKVWVIADGDTAGQDILDKLKLNYPAWDASHFINFSEPYFEKYYPIRFQNEVDRIMKIGDRKKRQGEKKQLLLTVWNWVLASPVDAKNEFSQSAHEIIEKLQAIARKI